MILNKIVKTKLEEVKLAKETLPLAKLIQFDYFKRDCYSLKSAINKTIGIIAEFKRCSPSHGRFENSNQIESVLKAYINNGAIGLSILTDSSYFGGSLYDIKDHRDALKLPILRKDFIIDEYQIYQAKAFGADCILLVSEILTPVQVKAFTDIAHSLGLEVLLELHSIKYLDRVNSSIDLIGVNNRDLDILKTDINTSIELSTHLPKGTIKISESGLKTNSQLKNLTIFGYRGFLIGEEILKSEDPGAKLAELSAEL